jgi:hypothetical protein
MEQGHEARDQAPAGAWDPAVVVAGKVAVEVAVMVQARTGTVFVQTVGKE